MLPRSVSSVDICAKEFASSNAIDLGVLDVFEAVAVLQKCQIESGSL